MSKLDAARGRRKQLINYCVLSVATAITFSHIATGAAFAADEAQWSDPTSPVYSALRESAGGDGNPLASVAELQAWAAALGVPAAEFEPALAAWTTAGLGNPEQGFSVDKVVEWIVAKSGDGGNNNGGSIYARLRDVAGADRNISEQEFLSAYIAPPDQGGPTQEQLQGFLDALHTSGTGTPATGYDIDKLVAFLLGMNATGQLPHDPSITGYTIEQVAAVLPAGLSPGDVQAFIDSLPRTADGKISPMNLDTAIRNFIINGHAGLAENSQFGGYTVTDNWHPTQGGGDTGTGTGSGTGTDTGGSGGTGTADSEGGSGVPPAQSEWQCAARPSGGSLSDVCRNSTDNRLSWRIDTLTGPALVSNETAITTTGDGKAAISLASARAGALDGATLKNFAALSTSGLQSGGILGGALAGPITIENYGAINTTGAISQGIAISSGALETFVGNDGQTYTAVIPGSSITIRNFADITTTGLMSQAISANSGGTFYDQRGRPVTVIGGDVTVYNEGKLSTAASYINTIDARSFGGNVAVSNKGAISTGGDSSSGMVAETSGVLGTVTVVNDGAIATTGITASGIRAAADGSGAVAVTNSGGIASSGTGSTGIEAKSRGSGDVSVSNGGTITAAAAGGTGIGASTNNETGRSGAPAGKVSIANTGDVAMSGAGSTGILATTSGGSIGIGSSGSIVAAAADSFGIVALGRRGESISITNSGLIQGGSGATTFSTAPKPNGDGLMFVGSAGILANGAVEISNSGKITAVNGVAIALLEGPLTIYGWNPQTQAPVTETITFPVATARIANTGDIAGALKLGGGDNVVENRGKITGDLTAGDGLNTITIGQGAAQTGNITLGNGANRIDSSGSITGNISAGDGGNGLIASATSFIKGLIGFGKGSDSVDNSGRIAGDIALGGGDNTLVNQAGAKITGSVTAGGGANDINNRGTLEGSVTLGDGANKVANSGALTGNILLGNGNNAVGNKGSITGDIALGGGNNDLANFGTVTGRVTLGDGANLVGNAGIITGDITAGRGDNIIGNDAGAVVAGNVIAGSGGNIVANKGTLRGNIALGDGANRIGNAGSIAGNVTAGDGGNLLVNEAGGAIKGSVTFGKGDDAVENAGRIDSLLALGGGANTLKVFSGGELKGGIAAGDGKDIVTNAGTIGGAIDLGGGANDLTNLTGGILDSGDRIAVGAGNLFTNSGELSPGGRGTVAKTLIIGDFVQTASGKLVVDINEKAAALKADVLEVTGRATLAGIVVPNVLDLSQVVKSEYKIVTAAGGAVNNGIAASPSLVAVSTIGYDFGVEFRNTNDVFLTAKQHLTLADIASQATSSSKATGAGAGNLAQIGTALSQIEGQGGGGLTPVLNAVRLQASGEGAAQVLNRLIPQNQGSQSSSTSNSGTTFGNAMLSCAERDGEYAYTREGKCYYAKLTARRLDRGATGEGAGVKENGFEAIGGVQVALYDQVRLGLALGYEETSSKTFDDKQNLGESTGNRLHAGVVLKNQWGPINAYLNIAGSFGSYEHKRFVNLAGIGQTALSDQEVFAGISRLRVSYLGDMGAWYWKPLVDVGANYLHAGGYTETNAGAANLRIADTSKWIFSVMPGLEIGSQMRAAGGTIFRPYIRGGMTFLSSDSYQTTASFDAAPAGIAPFIVTSRLDNVYADVEAGVHVLMTNGINLRFDYEGRFSENSRQNAGTIKASLPY